MAAAGLKDTVNNLVLIYPALCIPDNWNERYKTVEEIPDTSHFWGVSLGKRFFQELRNLDVYGTISAYKGPVRIIHGSEDPVVPLSYSENAVKRYDKAHLEVIQGAGHGFSPEEIIISNKFVKEFLEGR